jgi:hypothetical protein
MALPYAERLCAVLQKYRESHADVPTQVFPVQRKYGERQEAKLTGPPAVADERNGNLQRAAAATMCIGRKLMAMQER